MSLEDLRTYTEEEMRELGLGCGDNSCYFVKPKGMGTNGGCACLPDRSTIKTLIKIVPAYLDLKRGKK